MLRAIRCWLRYCPGYVISGWKTGRWDRQELWIGWRCHDCGRVLHYEKSEVWR